jgi:TolB-like protein
MADRAESENPGNLAEATAGAACRVFISYASHDADAANSICEFLERHGLSCWLAPRDVKPGAQYADAIVGAINDAKTVVLVLSGSAVASSHVGREVERAASKHKQIISFRMDATPLSRALEYFLGESQWIDVPKLGMPAALAKLAEAVGSRSATSAHENPVTHRDGGTLRRVTTITAILVCVGAAVALGVHFWSLNHRAPQHAAAITDKSIAVLPFTDMSEKKDQEYFADGMAEETLDLLAKIPTIKVIGRTSSFQFKGQNQDLRAIGAKLGAAYIVEGSVRKSGDRVRVTAQLVDARDGTRLWSETYDRSVGDVLMTQDDIAVGLVRALQITVGATELNARRSLRNVEAYDVYLRGRYAMDRYDKEGFEEAASDFRQALELDPKFADAAVALSLVYEMQANWAFVPSTVGYEQARRTADSVLKLDPALARAHTVLGMIHVHYDWDWEGAKREFEMALRSAPHDPFVLSAAGDLQLAIGHYAEAARMYKEALGRDPLDASTYDILSWAEIRLGQVAQAIASERKALEIQPEYVWAATYLASWLLVAGDPEAAYAAAQREDPAVRSGALSVTLWALGRKAEAEAAHKQAIVTQADTNPYGIAWWFAYRGDRDEAFKWLERAYTLKDPCVYAIKGEPLMANLVADPRYKAFLRKMNLPE